MRKRSVLELYENQKRHALNRGIEFQFSLDEWATWWEENLGNDWQKKRGRRRGQFVMARNGDKGPYAPGNVRCILCTDNQKEQISNGSSGAGWNKGKRGLPKRGNKLSNEQVLRIFHAKGRQKHIAEKFNVHPSCVSLIKSRKIWSHLTVGEKVCAS